MRRRRHWPDPAFSLFQFPPVPIENATPSKIDLLPRGIALPQLYQEYQKK
jgi:hypothetical protein